MFFHEGPEVIAVPTNYQYLRVALELEVLSNLKSRNSPDNCDYLAVMPEPKVLSNLTL